MEHGLCDAGADCVGICLVCGKNIEMIEVFLVCLTLIIILGPYDRGPRI